MTASRPTVERLTVRAFEVPTDAPESDGTLEWTSTTCVVVTLQCGAVTGLGYTYSHAATAHLIESDLAHLVRGADALAPGRVQRDARRALRNLGTRGIGAHAVAAVDTAMWDLKARLLGVPLATLLGRVRDRVPVYGSGGFTSYDDDRLARQLEEWVSAGIPRVKIKVGREPRRDRHRVALAREQVGPGVEIFVDANGAYTRKQALGLADLFHEYGVVWFEEPVASDDLEGLRLLRDRAPAGMQIAAGEYGYDSRYFRAMLDAGAVDVVQADATRCPGYTGLREVDALCSAWNVPLSTHCAPALHAPLAFCLPALVHLEYFHDHARLERLLFEGVPEPEDGAYAFDEGTLGHGLTLRAQAAEEFAA